jgi:hypothetical protein
MTEEMVVLQEERAEVERQLQRDLPKAGMTFQRELEEAQAALVAAQVTLQTTKDIQRAAVFAQRKAEEVAKQQALVPGLQELRLLGEAEFREVKEAMIAVIRQA